MDAVFLGQRSPKTEEKHDCMAVQKKGVVWDKQKRQCSVEHCLFFWRLLPDSNRRHPD